MVMMMMKFGKVLHGLSAFYSVESCLMSVNREHWRVKMHSERKKVHINLLDLRNLCTFAHSLSRVHEELRIGSKTFYKLKTNLLC